jgi:hypothetical protein
MEEGLSWQACRFAPQLPWTSFSAKQEAFFYTDGNCVRYPSHWSAFAPCGRRIVVERLLKVILEIAKVVREDFLQQNAFSPHDKMCPLYKTIYMLKNICAFYDLALKAVQETSVDNPITWNKIKNSLSKEFNGLSDMKFQLPDDGQEALTAYFKKFHEEIVNGFHNLID